MPSLRNRTGPAALVGAAVTGLIAFALFIAGGLLLWAALLGLLPGPRWFGPGSRVAALGFVWAVGGVLANLFLWSDRPFYAPYVDAPRTWALSALADGRNVTQAGWAQARAVSSA